MLVLPSQIILLPLRHVYNIVLVHLSLLIESNLENEQKDDVRDHDGN